MKPQDWNKLMKPEPRTQKTMKEMMNLFGVDIDKRWKRKERALLLMYLWQSIIDGITFAEALAQYEWAETCEEEPKVSYRTSDKYRFMTVKDIEFGATTLRLHKRDQQPVNHMPYRDNAFNCLNIIDEMLKEL